MKPMLIILVTCFVIKYVHSECVCESTTLPSGANKLREKSDALEDGEIQSRFGNNPVHEKTTKKPVNPNYHKTTTATIPTHNKTTTKKEHATNNSASHKKTGEKTNVTNVKEFHDICTWKCINTTQIPLAENHTCGCSTPYVISFVHSLEIFAIVTTVLLLLIIILIIIIIILLVKILMYKSCSPYMQYVQKGGKEGKGSKKGYQKLCPVTGLPLEFLEN